MKKINHWALAQHKEYMNIKVCGITEMKQLQQLDRLEIVTPGLTRGKVRKK